ncbi:MAG: polymer-forming cytoskeletal protein [Chloroflexi bacterium]|nr:MAG: polymer-forming cytoskeletal protein [Chloroflexota bacterium]TME56471.1 MAG: polymer-forming cytoskeletal protein [Chloroflexota bacterium]
MSTRPVARRPTPPPAEQPPGSSPAASSQPSSVTLGPRDRLIGQLYIEGDLRVGGILEGEVEVTGDIEIDDMAKVKASLAGGDVSVNGHLTGPVVARKRLIVGRSGSVTGDVRVARLAIQDGASFSGKVTMGAGAVDAALRPAKPAEPAVVEALAPAPEPAPPVAVQKPAPVEKPAPIVVAPPVVVARTDGKAKSMPPKPMPPKAIPPKGKQKKR